MRDVFEDIFQAQPPDPMESARRNMRPALKARFYKTAEVREAEGGHAVTLDGKPVRTPARRTLAAPSRELAELIAAEWDAQRETVDPAAMPLTRLINSIVDGVAPQPQPVADEIAKYLESDLLFYRADGPEGLVARQSKHWDPAVEWARDELGARFVLAQGVGFARQPAEAVARARAAIPSDPWRLGALNVVTALTGSALLGLALAAGRLSLDAVWSAAHVDEDWNMEFWGRDELALKRRAFQFAELQAAATVLAVVK
ncbi:MAG: ATPase [Alphaproteobacteria bacterium]|nr:ATPase [Alphaproteobacteria bacterium]